MTYKCKICGKEFDNSRSLDAHYHVHGGVNGRKDTTKCSCIYSKKVVLVSYLETHIAGLSRCKHCGKITSRAYNKFCSTSCAASHNNVGRKTTAKHRAKTSASIRKNLELNPKPPYTRVAQCMECGKWYHKVGDRRTCSDDCYKEIISRTAKNNPLFGGNRNNHAYGWYDSPFAGRVWLESSYEYRVAFDLDVNQIPWIRPPHMYYFLGGKKKKYFADFYLTEQDIYLDPKNDWLIPKDIPKINQAMKDNNVIIHILTKDQLSWAAIQELL
jgi:hypothetical protein